MKKFLALLMAMLLLPCWALADMGFTFGAEDPMEILTYCGNLIPHDAMDKLLENDPDLQIRYIDDYIGASAVVQALTNHDAAVDVYRIPADYVYARMMDKRLAADLSVSEILSADAQAMDPRILELLTDEEGRLRAYPAEISIQRWYVSEGLWHLVWGDEPIPTTVEALLNAWLDWETNYADDYPEVAFLEGFTYTEWCRRLVELYALQYEQPGEYLDLNAPALRTALDLLDQINDVRRRANRATTNEDYEDGWMEYAPIFTRGMGEQVMESYWNFDSGIDPHLYGVEWTKLSPLPLTFAEGDPLKYHGSMEVYVVNPYSEHQETALKFIEYATYLESDPYIAYATHPHLTEPVEDPSHERWVTSFREEVARIEAELTTAEPADIPELRDQMTLASFSLEQAEENRWLISTEDMEAYRAISDQIDYHTRSFFVGSRNEAATVIRELCSRYCAGSMSMDGFLKELSNRLSMMIQENQ